MIDSIFKYILTTGNIYIVIIFVLVLIMFYCIRLYFTQQKKQKNEGEINNKILLNIDNYCSKTISSLIGIETKVEKCSNNVDVSIEDVIDDISDIAKYIDEIKNNIKIIDDNIQQGNFKIEKLELNLKAKSDKLITTHDTVIIIKDELKDLKHRFDLLIYQIDNNNTINKGL